MARDISTARHGATVLGIGAVDVRSMESLQAAVDTCVKELGGLDFLMYAFPRLALAPSFHRRPA